ncbi:MAG TPA: hypothetical protein VNR38_02210 [Ureibacillus sp.]|nr:hypothetical protein [Ureibacillus sp.]
MGINISREELRFLSRLANLPIDQSRYELITPTLNEWIQAANELNEKMSDSKYLSIMPVTVFTHPEANKQQGE